MKKLFYLILLSCTCISAFAQQLNSKKLDSLFQKLDENKMWMGSFAISINGSPIYTKAIGFSDQEGNKYANTTSKYRIGSISKTFTATLIFQAIEAKQLTLDENLAKYFPTVPNAEKITIRYLLNHHSGIFNFTNNPDYVNWDTEMKSEAEMVQIISSANSDFEPGTKAAYSNSNYVLLGYILEKIYKKSLKEILFEKIIKPLGLKNTYTGDQINPSNNEVYSYQLTKPVLTKHRETHMSIPAGAGSVVSNPTDLNIFITALFNYKLVSAESLAQMKTLTDGYGFGLRQFLFGQKQGFGHNGGIDSFSSMLYYFPEDQLSISLISNGNTYENQKIFIAGLSAFYGKPFNIPTFATLTLKSEDLDQYLGVYASPDFPMKITIGKKENVLIAQASGQSSFPLEATAKHIFEFSTAGIVLEFAPEKKQMTIKQGAGVHILERP